MPLKNEPGDNMQMRGVRGPDLEWKNSRSGLRKSMKSGPRTSFTKWFAANNVLSPLKAWAYTISTRSTLFRDNLANTFSVRFNRV